MTPLKLDVININYTFKIVMQKYVIGSANGQLCFWENDVKLYINNSKLTGNYFGYI